MKDKPGYFSILPAEVRYANIPDSCKLLFAEISSLTNAEGYCYATNQYFAELYGKHKNSISRNISILERENFINIEMIKNPETSEIIERRIRLANVNSPINKIVNSPINKIVKDNNKDSFNNKDSTHLLTFRKEIQSELSLEVSKKEPWIQLKENVKMKESEYQKLISQYGENATDIMIQKLDDYKGSNGKRYKSDYRAILVWVTDWYKKNYETNKTNNDEGDYQYEV